MILVDKNIKNRVNKGELICSGYKDANVNSISYDLTIGEFIDENKSSIEIEPGRFIIIKTLEELNIPDDITGRIGEKNSLLRLGLKVDGPQYQPGHRTYGFLRVQNISNNTIKLSRGMKIAQIYFEELKEIPEVSYNKQDNASFNNENNYRYLGKHSKELNMLIKRGDHD